MTAQHDDLHLLHEEVDARVRVLELRHVHRHRAASARGRRLGRRAALLLQQVLPVDDCQLVIISR